MAVVVLGMGGGRSRKKVGKGEVGEGGGGVVLVGFGGGGGGARGVVGKVFGAGVVVWCLHVMLGGGGVVAHSPSPFTPTTTKC